MYFGEKTPSQCKGAILAHSLKLSDKTFKKGMRLTSSDIELIEKSGFNQIWVAILEGNDMHEDEAASALADSLTANFLKRDKAFTGRANIFATIAGIFCPNRDLIDQFNRIDPSITLATLDQFSPVSENQMVATIKIIPFAIENHLVSKADSILVGQSAAFSIFPYKQRKIGVLSTVLPHLKDSVIEKTLKTLEIRLEKTGSSISQHLKVEHETGAIAASIASLQKAGAEIIVIFGASAISDKSDVIPASIERIGGSVVHFGLPVDPGNLLLLGKLDGIRIIGAPGCARSPKENGFDWVLQRMLANIEIDSEMLTGMGVGGLLKEIVSRPVPRLGIKEDSDDPKIGAIVLAAGRSSRMGGPHKLLAEINGTPLVRIAAENALNSNVVSVTIVTGYMSEEISSALEGLDVRLICNSDYENGLSTSLHKGITSLPETIDGALIMLADMPNINSSHINSLIAAFNPVQGSQIVVSTDHGKRGNPVIWSRRYFNELCQLKGDVGAKYIIESNPESVMEIELGESARMDIDTVNDLDSVGGKITS